MGHWTSKAKLASGGALLVFCDLGCTAILGHSGSDSSEQSGKAGDGVQLDQLDAVDPESLADGVGLASRAPRLSYLEYDRTVSELLETQVTPSKLFPAEPPNLGPFDSGATRTVNERLLTELSSAAQQLAEETVTDSERYLRLVGCEPSSTGCRDSFLQDFGRRAYRRPLSDLELERFEKLFDSGADLISSGDPFRDGVELVVQATLQSPKFIYRVLQGNGQNDAAGLLLDGFEIASRLSFLFWGVGPDQELLEAAESGQLASAEGIAVQASRLAKSPKLKERLRDFHERWLQLDGLSAAEKDAAVYPAFGPALIGSMRAETNAFFDEVLLAQNGNVVDLMTSRYTAIDANLANLYGVEGTFGEELSPYQFPLESGRSGLLTRAAFLTGHSSAATRTSPILRGVFVLDRMLCEKVPPPPAGAEMQEPDAPPATEPKTTRDYFSWKTSMTACASCHSVINPVGFAFENFDGIGAYRETENGSAIDASGEMTIGQDTLVYDNATEMLDEVARSSRMRACYALHWLHYAYGRTETADDSRTLARMTQGMSEKDYGIRELLITLTQSVAFTHLPLTK